MIGKAGLATTERMPAHLSQAGQGAHRAALQDLFEFSRSLHVLRDLCVLSALLLRVLRETLRTPRSSSPLHAEKRRKRSELLTTVTDESAIAAAAKTGAVSRSGLIAGEAIARGIRMLL